MESLSLPAVLSIVTLIAVLVIGGYQYMRVHKSQKDRGEKPGGIAGPDPSE